MTIDERIVQLGLNNNNFEKHAAESLKTLNSLDKSLNAIGNVVGLDKFGNMMDTITHRFSALGIAGDQVIRKITDRVTNLIGQMGNLAKSMSFDQIEAGFDKYGEKTSAVQTIMAATSKDIGTKFKDQAEQMEYVNAQLEKLNWFTDETSYSFLDMVNNIGKFTSNGFGLEESVTAMEGISTWAAISGANVQEAGRAMYNLSQAMATGSVKLIDWKSIENANMATREFKETALETAVALGTLKKNADGSFTVIKDMSEEAAKKAEKAAKTFTTEQFNTELSSGWFSKDVLLETLQIYGRFTDKLNEASEATGKTASQMIEAIDTYKEGGSVAADLVPWVEELSKAEYDLGMRAFKAAQEAKTFEEAIKATKDAVSTGWMNIFEKIFGNYLEAKELWTDVAESFYNLFAEPVNYLNELVDIAFGGKTGTKIRKTAGKMEVLSAALEKSGKSSEDLSKVLSKIDDTRLEALVAEYGSLEEAINRGAVGAELLKQILSELGIGDEVADEVVQAETSVTSFEEKLAKAGRSMSDFEHAVLSVSDRAMLDMIEDYGGVEEALKKGAISADLFREALQFMAGEASGSAEAVGADISKLSGQIDDYRKVALEVLRGDWDNGEARRAALEAAGYNYEMIQWMAGNLQAYGYEISDEFLLSLAKTEDVQKAFEQIMINAGYTAEEIEAMNELLADSDQTLEDLQNTWQKIDRSQEKLDLVKGAELFRESIMNILHSLEGVASAVGQAFNLVFGGSSDAEEAVLSLGARLNDAIKRFHDFTETLVMNEDQIAKLRDRIAGLLRIISTVTSVVRTGVKIAFGLARTAFGTILSIIGSVTEAINALYMRLDRNGSFRRFAKGIADAFEGLRAAGKIVYDNIVGIFKYIKTVSGLKDFSFIKTVGDWLTILSVRFAIAAKKFKEFMSSAETARKIDKVFLTIFHLGKSVADVFGNLAETVSLIINAIGEYISGVIDKVKSFGSSLVNLQEGETFFSRIGSAIGTAFDWISNALSKLKGFVSSLFGGEGGGIDLLGILKKLLAVFIGFKAAKGIGKIFGSIGDLFGGIGSIGEFLKNPASIFENFLSGIKEMLGVTKKSKSFTDKLRSIAVSIGILALSLVLLSRADPENLAAAMGQVTTVLAELVGALKVIDGFSGGKKMAFAAGAMVGIAAAILLVAFALRAIAKIDPDRLTGAWEAMSLSLLSLIGAIALLSAIKIKSGKMLAAGAALIGLSVAMLVIAGALWVISKIDPERLTGAWEAMSLSLLSMVGALSLLSKINAAKLLAAGVSLALIAAAMVVMAGALFLFSKIDAEKGMLPMITALMAMSLALGLLGKFINPARLLAAGAALVLVAAAMVIMAIAIAGLGLALKVNENSMLAFIGIMAVMTIVLLVLGALGPVVLAAGAALLLAGAGFVALAAGMLVLGIALRVMEGLHIGKIAGQMLLLAIPLILLGAAGLIFGLGGIGLALGGVGLLVLGAALRIMEGLHIGRMAGQLTLLTVPLMLLGVAGLIFGLGGLGLALGGAGLLVLALALQMFNGVNVAPDYLLALGGALLALGVAGIVLGIGALGLLIGAPALMALALALPALADGMRSFVDIGPEALKAAFIALAEAIGALFLLQFSAIINGVPVLLSLAEAMPSLASGFKSFEDLDGEAISTAGTGLSKAIGALFKLQFSSFRDGSEVLSNLAGVIPKLAEGFSSFSGIDSEALERTGTALGNTIRTLFRLQFSTISDGTPQLKALGEALPVIANGFLSFGSINAEWLTGMTKALDTALSTLTNGGFFSKKKDYSAIIDLGNALSQFYDGISKFSEVDLSAPATAISTLMDDMQNVVYQSLPEFDVVGGEIVSHIADGIQTNSASVSIAVQSVPNDLANTFSSYESVWMVLGGNIVIGIANGIYDQSSVAVTAMTSLASSLQTTFQKSMDIHSPSRVMEKLAGYIPLGISRGIRNGSGSIKEGMVAAISPALAILSDIANDSFEFSPTVTPVVDLSNIDAASGYLNSALNGSYGLTTDVSRAIDSRLSDVERLAANMNAGQTINNGDNITFNIYASEGMDENAIADAVMSKMQTRAVRRTAAFG